MVTISLPWLFCSLLTQEERAAHRLRGQREEEPVGPSAVSPLSPDFYQSPWCLPQLKARPVQTSTLET